MKVEEFQVPVPWGHVAGKAWGEANNEAVLVFHGIADNAGSFDRLIPHLPSNFYYMCFDLPSHGKSSHYPPHLLISSLDNVFTFKLIAEYLNRKSYIIMGHSWGAQTGFLFTQLYPEYVTKLIVLDAVYMFPINVINFKDFLKGRFETLTKVNKSVASNKQGLYTYEEALNKLISRRQFGELTPESAKPILERSITAVTDDKFRFTVDPRLKIFVNLLCDLRFAVSVVDKYPVLCPLLFVCASESEFQLVYFKSLIKKIKLRNKRFVLKKVEGNHDVHNNSPEIVGPIICKFLLDAKSKL